MRICPTCSEAKDAPEYGASFYCKACMAARARVRRASDPERAKGIDKASRARTRDKVSARVKKWRAENVDHRRAYRKAKYAEMRERENELARQWKKNNPSICAALNTKRVAAKRRAIPSWANLAEIERLYEVARALTASTSIEHHVDHIVPLVSPIVCGLHCEANLQILHGRENQAKGNRAWPDMPDQMAA
jgi:5-methylcytosine-specific restriction endonuclease McrA